jgi:hypothetical protein
VLEIDKHERICKLPKCGNYDICGNSLSDERDLAEAKVATNHSSQVCDPACLLLAKTRTAQTKE